MQKTYYRTRNLNFCIHNSIARILPNLRIRPASALRRSISCLWPRLIKRINFFTVVFANNDVLKTIDGEIDYFDEVKGDSDTLAGLILELKGNIPEKGEVLTYKPYTFTIESVAQRRVKRVKVSIDA